MEASVTDPQVAAYRGMVARVARRYDGLGGAEFDDLEQEGLIAVWKNLQWSVWGPSELVVKRACLDWVRYCGKRGFSHETLTDE